MENTSEESTLIVPSRASVHVAVRNYLINELKLTKAAIIAEILPTVKDAVKEVLAVNFNASEAGKRWVYNLIIDSVRSLVRETVREYVDKTMKLHTKVVVEVLVPKAE